jgi:type II secretory pathway pseudopilin PulG
MSGTTETAITPEPPRGHVAPESRLMSATESADTSIMHGVETTSHVAGSDDRGNLRVRRDAGVSLVEVVIALALIGVIVIPILIASATLIRSTVISESAAEVETMLVNAVDRVHRSDRGSFQCDFTIPVEAAVMTYGWPQTSASVGHEHLDGGVWVAGGCPSTGFYSGLVQRVTVTITSPDGRVSRTLQVIKGDI